MNVLIYPSPFGGWHWLDCHTWQSAGGYPDDKAALAGWHAWLLRRVQAYYWEAES